MHYFLATLAALAATAMAQSSSNAGCSPTVPGKFLIVPLNVSLSQVAKRDSAPPPCQTPTITLNNGILKDQSNSQGEIVANNQLQFDPILQPGRKFDSGFCVYGNGSLAVGGSAIFYSCISGSFSNLYNKDIGSVCSQVYLNATTCVDTGSTSSSSSSSSSSSTSSSSSSSSSSSTSVTTSRATTPATVPSTPATSAVPPPVVTPSPAPAAPFPVSRNTTTPAASGSAAGTGSRTTTATTAGTSSTTRPATFQPSSGANAFAIGSQLVAGIAAIGAFAMF